MKYSIKKKGKNGGKPRLCSTSIAKRTRMKTVLQKGFKEKEIKEKVVGNNTGLIVP